VKTLPVLLFGATLLRLFYTYKNKKTKTKHSLPPKQRVQGYPWQAHSLAIEKGKQTVLFAINQGWSYELVPCSDEAILAVDEELGL
jgi:hypothetical protein